MSEFDAQLRTVFEQVGKSRRKKRRDRLVYGADPKDAVDSIWIKCRCVEELPICRDELQHGFVQRMASN